MNSHKANECWKFFYDEISYNNWDLSEPPKGKYVLKTWSKFSMLTLETNVEMWLFHCLGSDEGQIPRQLSSDSVFSSDTLGAEAPVTKETEQMVSQLILNPATQLVRKLGNV